MTSALSARWHRERAYWRLRLWQFVGLVVLSVWPWLIGALMPENQWLAMAPVIVFMPLAYLGGSVFMALLPGLRIAYPLGVSVTIFFIAYLVMVSWRQRHRESK